jgi:polyvinyl alcohol dehydrogenase (cytochrome)
MTTGNNTMVPQTVLNCLGTAAPPSSCMSPDNHFDSIIGLDMDTGAINWSARGLPSDVWNVACGLNVPGFLVAPGPFFPGVYGNCPNGTPIGTGPDWDFGQGPMILSGGLVGAGQKSGMFWAFHVNTGKLAWNTQAAPGGITGGLQWGSATDGKRVFVAAANSGTSQMPAPGGAAIWMLKDGSPTTSGGWAALDAKTGAVVWTTKDPIGSRAEAAVSATNDVVFGCKLAPGIGKMVAMHAETGAILWSYDSGGPCNAGASISYGMVFWGSGNYSGFGTPKKVFGFGF